ncbi:hypothetical protein KUTeg_016096 [Tegillarca granosa]|uniref:Uncharacterized protein n=1 Tax=Tegillarca granosa TaxID=220873 RepID=A0ABQ9EMD8_TEGGR|nr:hypothetical protein KUTeg_016096 [Tegillarca granosa]
MLNLPNTDKSHDVICANDKIASFNSTSGAKIGEPSELFDTDNDDWAPTLNLGHKLACIMPKRPGKSNNKKRKIHNKPWANSNDAEVQVDNHVLKGSMMVPRVIFDESSDSLTLSKYKNLLSFTISVGEDGDCDIVPKIDDNENTHLELVLMPKAYLNDSGFRQASKTVSNYDINVKIEPEDPEYGESTCKRSSNMTNESEIMQESMEEYAPFHSGISDTVPNLVVENSDYISHQRLQTTLSGYNSDSSEPETKSLKLNCNDTSVLNSEDSSLQTYTENSMYIKKEVDDDEEEKQGNSMNQLKSYSIKFFIPKGFKNDKSESKPSILQRNTSKLSVHDLFKYLKTKISLNQTNEFYPWSVQMNSDYILFSQMAPVDFPVVSRQVMLNKDLTYTIRVHAQDLPEKHNIYGSNKKVLKSVTDIKHLLKQIDSYNTCSGNHDRRSNHFFLLHSDSDPVHPAIREGNFGGTTMNGSTYEWTIRSKACTLLVKSFLDKCPECNMYYKTAKSAPVPNAYGGE